MVNADHCRGRSRRTRVSALAVAVVALVAVLGSAACEPAPDPATVLNLPLHTDGGRIVDADGDEVVLQGVNWFGFETDTHVVHGLWARDYRSMLGQMADEGYNVIRLPWSVAGIRSPSITSVNTSLGANAELAGLTSLQAMDAVIEAAADEGLMVLLDNHRLDDRSIPELWYGGGYTEQDWLDAWVSLAQRYADQPNVIGADLKNEPHGAATWGTGDRATDWRLAAERAGNAVLAQAPDWLIVVEGIGGSVAGQQLPGHWWGGNLEGARTWPVRLDVADRLVYSPHEYGPGVSAQPWFQGPDVDAVLLDRWEKGFAHLVEEGIAPVLVGELGGRQVGTDTVEGRWQNQLVDFLAARGYSWTYWSWNPNSSDTGGILADDWTTVHADKQAMLDRALIDQPRLGTPTAPPTTTGGPTTAPVTTAPTTTTTSAPASTTAPTGSVSFAFAVDSQWATGYCGQFTATNGTGTAVTTLGLRFTLRGATITSTWNGTVSQAGDQVTVDLPPWADALEAGATETSFGFCATTTGADPRPRALTALT